MGAPRRWSTPVVTVAVIGLAAVMAALLAGLVFAGGDEKRPSGDDHPVIQPGRPGEPGRTAGPRDPARPGGLTYNDVDVSFVRMMIPHHQQAVQMAELAPGRAADPRILAVADRIRAAQGPEILRLKGWLSQRGFDPEAPPGDHDHSTMRGMQPAEKLRTLTGTSGAAFDRMFVDMMSDHHEGAIAMAKDALTVGMDPDVEEIATSVGHEQAVEITRMRELLPA